MLIRCPGLEEAFRGGENLREEANIRRRDEKMSGMYLMAMWCNPVAQGAHNPQVKFKSCIRLKKNNKRIEDD